MFNHELVNFEVEKAPLFHKTIYDLPMDRINHNVGQLIRRKDTKLPFGIVGKNYEILQYNTVVSDIEQALKASGLDIDNGEYQTNLYRGGAQLELVARFPSHRVQIDNDVNGVIPEFKFRTSQDSSWASNGMMGLWRFACYNTLPSGNKLAYVYGRHTKGFSLPAFCKKIKNAGEYITGTGITEMKKWFNTPLHRDKAIELFSNTLAKRNENVKRSNKPNQVMLSQLINTFDEENRFTHGRGLYQARNSQNVGSMWTAYQAATHWSTFKDTTRSRSSDPQNIRVDRESKVKKMLRSSHWKELENV